MGRRMPASLSLQRLAEVEERGDEPVCSLCEGKRGAFLYPPFRPYQDGDDVQHSHAPTWQHRNGNDEDHSLENLERVHRGCNTAERNARAARAFNDVKAATNGSTPDHAAGNVPSIYVYANEKNGEDPYSLKLRQNNGYMDPSAPAQMRAGARTKPAFRSWLIEHLEQHGTISAKDAVAEGAERTGMDITTIARWMAPMVSKWSGAVEQYEAEGEAMLRLKPIPMTKGGANGPPGAAEGNGPPARRRPPPGQRTSGPENEGTDGR